MNDEYLIPAGDLLAEESAREAELPAGDISNLAATASRIGKLSVIYIVGGLAPQIVGMLLLPVFTRYMAPEQMGMFYLMLRIMDPVTVFIQLGLFGGLKMQYFHVEVAHRRRLLRSVLWLQLAQGLLVSVLLSAAGWWLAGRLLPELPLTPSQIFLFWLFIVWCAFFTAIQQLTAGTAQLLERADLSVGLTSFSYIAQAVIGLILVVEMGYQGFGRCGSVVVGGAITTLIAVPMMWSFGAGRFSRALIGRVFWKGLAFVPQTLAGYVGTAISAWLVGYYASLEALGIFGIGVAFVGIIQLPLNSVNTAIFPTLATLMKFGTAEAKRQQVRLYTIMAIGTVALTLGVALFAPVGIHLLTAAKYHPAEQIVIILALGYTLFGFYVVVSDPVFFFGGGPWMTLINVLAQIAGIAAGLALIPRFHYFGAAWALVANQLAFFLVGAWASNKLYPLPWELGRIIRAVACGALLAAADHYWLAGQSLLVSVPLKSLLWLSLFPLLLLVRAVTKDELRQAAALVGNKLRGLVGA